MKKKLDFYIIDDSDVNNYYTDDLLREFNFTKSVTIFTTAAEALQNLFRLLIENKKLPDVILLDIRMPDMSGFDFIKKLGEKICGEKAKTHIFILTSSQHHKDIQAFDQQEMAKEFLNKPLEKNVLLKTIQAYFVVG